LVILGARFERILGEHDIAGGWMLSRLDVSGYCRVVRFNTPSRQP